MSALKHYKEEAGVSCTRSIKWIMIVFNKHLRNILGCKISERVKLREQTHVQSPQDCPEETHPCHRGEGGTGDLDPPGSVSVQLGLLSSLLYLAFQMMHPTFF